MPGWYIHMNVARKAIPLLATNPTAAPVFTRAGLDSASIIAIAAANPTYTALGAIGPDIFFMLPDFKPKMGNMIWTLANTIRDLYTWWDDNFLGPVESALGPIGANLDDELNALTGGLKDSLEGVFNQAFSFLKDFILRLILEQYDVFGLLSSGVPTGYDEQTFFWSDMLHYRETYRFAAELWRRAGDATIVSDPELRDRFRAFALGWMTHLATDVTGHAFVNQKAGGPYRLHWQRHHLVENHMDAQVYNTDHGAQAIYQQMANSALHLWLAFNPDGSSRVNFFDAEPNPPYPDGDHSADIVGRHAVWDVDSDIPDELAQFLSDTLKAVYPSSPWPPADANGMEACCPTIISALDDRVPIRDKGYAEKEDIVGAYWWLFKYLKWVTTDYYKIRRPEEPDIVVIPSFPSPPGSGDSDAGPGAGDDSSLWDDILSFLASLFAWATYLAEVALWPLAVVAGIIAGTITYPLRWLIYEYLELPLYNLWLGVHTYLAMTGYVMPMPGEINKGLNTLGVSVADNWAVTVAALGTPDGGLTPAETFSADPSGMGGPFAALRPNYPRDVLVDPPNLFTVIVNTIFDIGTPAGNGEFPSEFSRPWRFPLKDEEGDPVNIERPATAPGPFVGGQDANALFGAAPGSQAARDALAKAKSELETIEALKAHLPLGEHLGDPQDYAAYVIASLTRDPQPDAPEKIVNFNLDADRGYGYLCWDWVRDGRFKAVPKAFNDGADDIEKRTYNRPVQPGYGWTPGDAGALPTEAFNPDDPSASVKIRYIDKEPRS